MAAALRFFTLAHDAARRGVGEYALRAPEGTEVVFRKATRSDGQSRLFHKLLGQIARSGLEWHGKRRTVDAWKALIVSGHTVATMDEDPELTVGIEGELISLRESTANMDKGRSSSLIEYTLAFMAAQGIRTDDGPPAANEPNYTAPRRAQKENAR